MAIRKLFTGMAAGAAALATVGAAQAQDVRVKYADDIQQVAEFIPHLIKASDVNYSAEGGFDSPNCGEITIGDKTIRFSSDDIMNGKLPVYIDKVLTGREDTIPAGHEPSCLG